MLRALNRFMAKHGQMSFAILLIILVVPLVFVFGNNSCSRETLSGPTTVYGKLSGKKVTDLMLRKQFYAILMSQYLQSGRDPNFQQISFGDFITKNKDSALDRMRILMLAEDQGFNHVSNEELAAYLRRQEAFKTTPPKDKDGKSSKEPRYSAKKFDQFKRLFFKNKPFTYGEFEEFAKQNIVLERAMARFGSSTASEAERRLQEIQGRMQTSYKFTEYPYWQFTAAQEIEEDTIKQEYENHKDGKYKIPQQYKALIAQFKIEDELPNYKEPTDTEIMAYYEKQKDDYKTEDQVRASHILISYKGAARSEEDRSKEEAEKLANEILKKAKAKDADFAALAKEHSDGPSGEKGGDLNFFPRGGMAKPFSDAAFALKEGEISDVVETQFGFHIIMKTGERPAGHKPLKDVRNRIVSKLKDEQFAANAKERYEKNLKEEYTKKQMKVHYLSITKERSGTDDEEEKKLDKGVAENILAEARKAKDLKEFGKEIKKKYEDLNITALTYRGKFVGVDDKELPDYIAAAKDLKVGEVSDLIDEGNAWYIVQKADERDVIPFDEVKSQIVSKIKQELREEATAKAMAQTKKVHEAVLAADADKREDVLRQKAEELGGSVTEPGFIGSDTGKYIREVMGGISPRTLYPKLQDLTSNMPVSDPFQHGNFCGMALLIDIQAPRTPEYDEVKSKIIKDLKQGKAMEDALTKAKSIAESLEKQLAKTGKSPLIKKERFQEGRDYRYYNMFPQMYRGVTPEQLRAYTESQSMTVNEARHYQTDRGAMVVVVDEINIMGKETLGEDFEQEILEASMTVSMLDWTESLKARYPFIPEPEFEKVFAANDK